MNLSPKKSEPLKNAPAARRIKTYSARSGYVYQYFYEGQRRYEVSGETGTQFVFSISPDRRTWRPTAVLLAAEALRAWEQAHARDISQTEQYAIAKMALFQAFDERETPALMRDDVRVRPADVAAILETLGLD
ncbi:MAG TPA: hypothetical protein VG675_10520 [Bryobacteraceae bacterium]|nr:hypothetical protein [Bryobacteraceae bacterium]